jgi:uncharacterized protein YwgA
VEQIQVTDKDILCMLASQFELKRDTKRDRLRLQKIIYLLQSYGLQLGYGFSWYKHGPYSQELVYDAYRVLNSEKDEYKERMTSLSFTDSSKQKFQEFENLLAGILDNPQMLELVASLHFVEKTWYSQAKPAELVEKFKNHKVAFFDNTPITDDQIKTAFKICQKLN